MASTYESQMPRLFITRVLGFTSLCAVPTFILPPLSTVALQTSNTGETGHTTFPAPSHPEPHRGSLRTPHHRPLFQFSSSEAGESPRECNASHYIAGMGLTPAVTRIIHWDYMQTKSWRTSHQEMPGPGYRNQCPFPNSPLESPEALFPLGWDERLLSQKSPEKPLLALTGELIEDIPDAKPLPKGAKAGKACGHRQQWMKYFGATVSATRFSNPGFPQAQAQED